MKVKKRLVALFAALVMLAAAVGLIACGNKNTGNKNDYVIGIDSSLPLTVEVGDKIDYKQYFVVIDKDGKKVDISDDMLDLSNADTSKAGQFTITLKIGNTTEKLTFTVVKTGDEYDEIGVDDLHGILLKYADDWTQNFASKVTVTGANADYTDIYEFLGENIKWTFEDDEGNTYTDYVGYDDSTNKYTYYYSNGNGTYTQYDAEDNEDEFLNHYLNMNIVDLSKLSTYEYAAQNGGFAAKTPGTLGNAALGEFEDSTWTSFTLFVANGNVAKIVAETSDGYTFTYVLSKFGSISFTLPDSGGTTKPTEPTGTMDKQIYNSATFDKKTLQDKITTTGKYADPYIGLPSTGTYNALVIPVEFGNTTITKEQLGNLNLAFNDTTGATGWESVKSYYQKASYGKLNISFDIAGVMDGVEYYKSDKTSTYYEQQTEEYEGQTYNNGDNVLLHEVLEYYESRLDLTKYDSNNDGAIDAVYLIYSAPVDYGDDSFYWAYVTWDDDGGAATYDGKDVYYYLFAGLDFMIESVKGGYTNEYYPVISGLNVNAATYIHETGHLFGLDDYYDYAPNQGSDEGLGGADMMDATVGDQNVYSKIMLGWLTPEIVVSTKTITIKSSQEQGDAILIPLKFDNSYFCEYLLIDLYSAEGLNELHANMSDSYLYGGAGYGVRIYHVSSWIENPFDNDFGSFTDNNNSMSDAALIKLVEADGETKFASGGGYAESDDLWQAGDKLSDVFPQYVTNDGKTLIFDISIDSVSAAEATITITYAA